MGLLVGFFECSNRFDTQISRITGMLAERQSIYKVTKNELTDVGLKVERPVGLEEGLAVD